MEINFTTNNIDRKLYQQLILYYIYEHYNPTDFKRIIEQDKWKIEIKRTQDFDKGFYEGAASRDQLDYSINKKETPDLAKQELQKQKDKLENQRVMIVVIENNL